MNINIRYERIIENLQTLQAKYHKDILLVVKNNAYNVGLEKTIQAALSVNVTHFMVTEIESAIRVREMSPQSYILVMRPLTRDELIQCQTHQLATIIPSVEWYENHSDHVEGIDLHLKINVGMNRFGVQTLPEAEQIVQLCQASSHQLVGLCTHFPQADEENLSQHMQQVSQFQSIYDVLKKKVQFQYIHAENSATLMQENPELGFCNYARIGILAYGYSPTIEQEWLKPSLFVYASVIDVKDIQQGAHLGYGTAYTAQRKERIATLDIGYGDGLVRRRNELPVHINGCTYPFVGRISMSHSYVEVDQTVQVGARVEIFGDATPIDYFMREVGGLANSEIMSYLRTERSEK